MAPCQHNKMCPPQHNKAGGAERRQDSNAAKKNCQCTRVENPTLRTSHTEKLKSKTRNCPDFKHTATDNSIHLRRCLDRPSAASAWNCCCFSSSLTEALADPISSLLFPPFTPCLSSPCFGISSSLWSFILALSCSKCCSSASFLHSFVSVILLLSYR